ncbi:MAG: glutathione S-transferase family protein [bacterium]|nr:glutathione S-transferase family protein [bacterium]
MIRVYGCRISYYTGKLESYLRFRSIAYEPLPTEPHRRRILAGAGAVQMPVLELEDGRWLSDSSPIIAWFEGQQDSPSVYPSDPALRFVALLLEDYADEWLWRSAMHYRWSFRSDREYASGVIVDDVLQENRLPRFLKRFLVARRQFGGFVRGDGVSETTLDHVERGYLNALDLLEAIFERRRFLLGEQPTVADFGMMGPMLRHFGQDPTPQEIMRRRAPGVYAWVARMWNARATSEASALISEIDAPLSALLGEAGETHLVQLRENAAAYGRGLERYDQVIQGCRYEGVPSSRYRVWCLEELRREWAGLDDTARGMVLEHLPQAEAAVLWDDSPVGRSDYDPERRAPFNRAINVFGTGVPQR